MADSLKAEGNAAFSAGDFKLAVEKFSAAIDVDASNHVFFSNRSASYASLGDYNSALADAETCVSINPTWPKGYSRLGAALQGMRKFAEAKDAYSKGLELDASNAQMAGGLKECEAALSGGGAGGPMGSMGSMFSSPEMWSKLAANPKTRDYLQQQDYLEKMRAIAADPNKLGSHMNDPRILESMGVVMGVNIFSGDNVKDAMGGAGFTEGSGGSRAAAPTPPPEPTPEPEPEMTEEEKAAKQSKEAALAEKEKGNAAYKAKDFDVAIKHYDAAIALDPKEISFLSNRAAVKFEQAKYAESIEDCEKAIEVGRENRADYKAIARAMTRIGSCHVKQGDLDQGIYWFNKALTEHRNPDTLKKLQNAEKEKKDSEVKAYINPELAAEEKAKGNECFKGDDYPTAVKHYTEALKRLGPDGEGRHLIYSNRAACYTKLFGLNEALKDAELCIEIAPDFVKGYTRKAAAQFFMKDYDKALASYHKGLDVDATNDECKDGVRRCMEQINKANSGQLTEDEMKQRQERAMANPEVQEILGDPVMRQVLNDMQQDPKAAQTHMQNPGVAAKIQKLVNAGIIQVR